MAVDGKSEVGFPTPLGTLPKSVMALATNFCWFYLQN